MFWLQNLALIRERASARVMRDPRGGKVQADERLAATDLAGAELARDCERPLALQRRARKATDLRPLQLGSHF